MINKARIEELLKHIKSIPDEEFDYSNWFSGPHFMWQDRDAWEDVRESAIKNKKHPCHTAGCVAGHTCMLWWNEAKDYIQQNHEELSIYQIFAFAAQEILGIDDITRNQLFINEAETANKADAIKRLKHILKHGNLNHYPWSKESSYCQ